VAKRTVRIAAVAHRAPKQDRSRDSFERLIATGIEMVRETGGTEFTLVSVSRRAKIAISSIYYRVKNKEDLIRIIQQRAYEKIDRDYAEAIAAVRRRHLPLQPRMTALVGGVAAVLRQHVTVLFAMRSIAAKDPLISATGQHYYQAHLREWITIILECREEISHPGPEHAAGFTFRLLFNMVISRLEAEIFTGVPLSAQGWNSLVDDLGVVCLAMLKINPKMVRSVVPR
jgi:AcrR family transcriptional regulator